MSGNSKLSRKRKLLEMDIVDPGQYQKSAKRVRREPERLFPIIKRGAARSAKKGYPEVLTPEHVERKNKINHAFTGLLKAVGRAGPIYVIDSPSALSTGALIKGGFDKRHIYPVNFAKKDCKSIEEKYGIPAINSRLENVRFARGAIGIYHDAHRSIDKTILDLQSVFDNLYRSMSIGDTTVFAVTASKRGRYDKSEWYYYWADAPQETIFTYNVQRLIHEKYFDQVFIDEFFYGSIIVLIFLLTKKTAETLERAETVSENPIGFSASSLKT